MIKLLLPLFGSAMLAMTFCANSQESTADDVMPNDLGKAISEEQVEVAQTDDSLWETTRAKMSLESLSVYLVTFPNGKHSSEANLKFSALEKKAQSRSDEDKALEAYRKRRVSGGLVLELDSKFTDVRPYVRSMLNTCGYTLVKPHRFAKRVYPTVAIDGRIYNGQSDGEYAVTLDLSVVLKTKTREIKERQKVRSYRTSDIDTHQALVGAFEDIGAQINSGGFCISE